MRKARRAAKGVFFVKAAEEVCWVDGRVDMGQKNQGESKRDLQATTGGEL
jgi:hypothetical protein